MRTIFHLCVRNMFLQLFLCNCTGQFWNIPFTIHGSDGIFGIIEVNEMYTSKYRLISVLRVNETFDGTHHVCYYTAMKTGVTEGIYSQYQTDSLFATNFDYTLFNDKECK